MREHDPNNPELTRPESESPRRDAPLVDNRSSMGMIGVIAGIAIALVVGFLLWNMGDTSTDTASDTSPGQTTTGAAPKTTPPASPSTGTGATPPANNAPAKQGTTPAPSR